MAVWLAGAILSVSQAASTTPPRLIAFVTLTPQGDIQVRIENPSPKPLDAAFVVELALGPRQPRPRSDTPSFAA